MASTDGTLQRLGTVWVAEPKRWMNTTAPSRAAGPSLAYDATLHVYDSRDRVARIAGQDGSQFTYGYDAMGNRTSIASRTRHNFLPFSTMGS